MKEKRFASVDLSRQRLTEIPEKYKDSIIDGDFNISKNEIKSLKNSPKLINGNFNCSHNMLLTCEDGPRIVKGDYLASSNNILLFYGIDRPDREFGFTGHGLTGCFDDPIFDTEKRTKEQFDDFTIRRQKQYVKSVGNAAYNFGNTLLSLKNTHSGIKYVTGIEYHNAIRNLFRQTMNNTAYILELLENWDPLAFKIFDEYYDKYWNINIPKEELYFFIWDGKNAPLKISGDENSIQVLNDKLMELSDEEFDQCMRKNCRNVQSYQYDLYFLKRENGKIFNYNSVPPIYYQNLENHFNINFFDNLLQELKNK